MCDLDQYKDMLNNFTKKKERSKVITSAIQIENRLISKLINMSKKTENST